LQYVNKTFTLPTTAKKMTQTDYEIAVGLRNPDGSLRRPKKSYRQNVDEKLKVLGLDPESDRTCPGIIGGPAACICGARQK
jgi:hypothetical protein